MNRIATPITPSSAAGTFEIVLDGSGTGRVFEGIGALSGGGASSRLLVDYPPEQLSDILDFLFKPNFGAAFHHLKVEIGGDLNSTDGSEPSHAHSRAEFENPTAENFNRGYEWFIMREAKARNPDILLDALEWGAPGWIGNGTPQEKFYSQDNIDYILQYLNGTWEYHGLAVNYVGIWNEMPYDIPWIKALKAAVEENNALTGLTTQVVAAEQINNWDLVTDMLNDPELYDAVDVVGVHYPSWGAPDEEPPRDRHDSTPEAKDSGKRLWASEDGVWRDRVWNGSWDGTKELARIYNRNYAVGRMTKTNIWNLVTAYYDNLLLPYSGVMRADSPWSGNYDVQSGIWVTAHTTQFAQPGWQYLDDASGLLRDEFGQDIGSHVALKAPNESDYSVILETTEAAAPITARFTVTGGLSTGPVHVWRTTEYDHFVQLTDITPDKNGAYVVTLEPAAVYSLTTTTGQQKGQASHANPPPAAFPLLHADDFEGYTTGALPRYLADQAGAFEVALATVGGGQVLRQLVSVPPTTWDLCLTPDPYTFLGNGQWFDYRVRVQAYFGNADTDSAYAVLLGRINEVPCSEQFTPWPDGYELGLDQNGAWGLTRTHWTFDSKTRQEDYEIVVLAEGTVPDFDPTAWHGLELQFRQVHIAALIDGISVGTATDTLYSRGRAGFGSGWHTAEFDQFAIEPVR